jgi:hypothetical protein
MGFSNIAAQISRSLTFSFFTGFLLCNLTAFPSRNDGSHPQEDLGNAWKKFNNDIEVQEVSF